MERMWQRGSLPLPFGECGCDAKTLGLLHLSCPASSPCLCRPFAQADRVTGSRSGARERRLQKIYEERKRRDQMKGDYPQWARVLEDACKLDKELREIIGDSMGNAEEMQKRVEERVRRKGKDIVRASTGSAVPMKVSFRDFDSTNSYVWIELYSPPSDKDVDIIGSVFRSWYLLGRLGAFNSLNMQISKTPPDQGLSYNEKGGEGALPAFFHNIGMLEFQDNLGRVWADLGTADALALDVFINSLACVSSEHVGIKELTFGGKRLGDWEEGMTSTEDGYISYKI